MNKIEVKEGWNDAAHLCLLRTAAEHLAEVGVISKEMLTAVNNVLKVKES